MNILYPFVLLISVLPANSLPAQITLANKTTFSFASVDQAKEILTNRDDFVRRMSPFDRAARMKTDRDVSQEDYLKFVGKNVLAWNDAEQQKVVLAFRGVQPKLEDLSLPLPKKVLFIKTTGNEEGGASYTRANAVVFPQTILASSPADLRQTICHELFHVMSRANPELREKLYAAIGFVKCDEVLLPSDFTARKITNPDAPVNDHCIRLQLGGNPEWAIPIIFSNSEKYDTAQGGEFFNYLRFRFLIVQRDENSTAVKPAYDVGNPKLAELRQVSAFFEQVGKNTGYIIHPEEILADNFALLVLQKRNVPSPAVIQKIKEILH